MSEQIFAICALYTTLNFEATVSLACGTPVEEKRVELDYPFRFGEKVCPKRGSKGNSTLFLSADVSSDAQFFVATGVLSLLYSVFIIGVYTMIDDFYRSKSEVPLAVSGHYFQIPSFSKKKKKKQKTKKSVVMEKNHLYECLCYFNECMEWSCIRFSHYPSLSLFFCLMYFRRTL